MRTPIFPSPSRQRGGRANAFRGTVLKVETEPKTRQHQLKCQDPLLGLSSPTFKPSFSSRSLSLGPWRVQLLDGQGAPHSLAVGPQGQEACNAVCLCPIFLQPGFPSLFPSFVLTSSGRLLLDPLGKASSRQADRPLEPLIQESKSQALLNLFALSVPHSMPRFRS